MKDFTTEMQLAQAKDEIRCCDDLSRRYGLTLSDHDVAELVQLRQDALNAAGRVELGGGILPKLIRAFCSSPYVGQRNYCATLADLQEAFYYFKNESMDLFSDDDLIEFMAKVFNGRAEGSTELLCAISLEDLCRWARNDFVDPYADEEEFD